MDILILKEQEPVFESVAQKSDIILGINSDGSISLLKDRFGDTKIIQNPNK